MDGTDGECALWRNERRSTEKSSAAQALSYVPRNPINALRTKEPSSFSLGRRSNDPSDAFTREIRSGADVKSKKRKSR
ncbi:hypothetical protein V9T40_003774 [Parthenolecanium corni]|uniref:Uncharacterized protein n=1 Tax=Parthenolecanium corni TaxID=536013 RepID=A0AAN9TVY2_9HEMI